ncbi:hypothetical protein BH11ACT2_BH11ACT2_13580 [soil metagenome]
MEDYHPELANYEPHERPIRSTRTLMVMRFLVIVAIAGLVLPGVITTYTFAQSSAQNACAVWVNHEVAQQHSSFARFEGLSWECYSVTADGTTHVTSLGLLPGLDADQAREAGIGS